MMAGKFDPVTEMLSSAVSIIKHLANMMKLPNVHASHGCFDTDRITLKLHIFYNDKHI